MNRILFFLGFTLAITAYSKSEDKKAEKRIPQQVVGDFKSTVGDTTTDEDLESVPGKLGDIYCTVNDFDGNHKNFYLSNSVVVGSPFGNISGSIFKNHFVSIIYTNELGLHEVALKRSEVSINISQGLGKKHANLFCDKSKK